MRTYTNFRSDQRKQHYLEQYFPQGVPTKNEKYGGHRSPI